jgi:hypothetical protein
MEYRRKKALSDLNVKSLSDVYMLKSLLKENIRCPEIKFSVLTLPWLFLFCFHF